MKRPRLRWPTRPRTVATTMLPLIFACLTLAACAGESTHIRTDESGLNRFLYGFRDGFLSIIAGVVHWIGGKVGVYVNPGHFRSYDGGFAVGEIVFWLVLPTLFYILFARPRRRRTTTV